MLVIRITYKTQLAKNVPLFITYKYMDNGKY